MIDTTNKAVMMQMAPHQLDRYLELNRSPLRRRDGWAYRRGMLDDSIEGLEGVGGKGRKSKAKDRGKSDDKSERAYKGGGNGGLMGVMRVLR